MDDIAHQYRIIFDGAAGAGWAEKTVRGRLRFDGADRLSFLQALMTNEIAALQPGTGAYTAYLTPQGRMIADLHVFVRPDHVMADVPAASAASLTKTFDRLIFSEDVAVTDRSADLRQFTVIGGRAAELLASSLGLSPAALRGLAVWSQLDFTAGVGAGFVIRTDDLADGSWDVVVPVSEAAAVTAAFESAGIVQASPDLIESLRIDEGRPQFGVDMTTDTIPLEAGLLDRAISQSKGCYVGQEVIIRVLHRGAGRVAKRLVRIAFDPSDPTVPAAGAKIASLESDKAQDVGSVTSAAWSPRAERVVAMGYVSRETAEPGKSVSVGGRAGTITTLAS